MKRASRWGYGILIVISVLSLFQGGVVCWAGVAPGTSPKNDPPERVTVTVGQSLYHLGSMGGAPCISAEVGVRLGERE